MMSVLNAERPCSIDGSSDGSFRGLTGGLTEWRFLSWFSMDKNGLFRSCARKGGGRVVNTVR